MAPRSALDFLSNPLGGYQSTIEEYDPQITGLKNDYAEQLALANAPSTISQSDAFLSAINMLLPAMLGAAFAKNKNKGIATGLGAGVLGSQGFLKDRKEEANAGKETAKAKAAQIASELKEKIDFQGQIKKEQLGAVLDESQFQRREEGDSRRSKGFANTLANAMGAFGGKGAAVGGGADLGTQYQARFDELKALNLPPEQINEIITREMSGEGFDGAEQAAVPAQAAQGKPQKTLDEIAQYLGLDLNDPAQLALVEPLTKAGVGAQTLEKGRVDLQQKQFDLETAKGPNATLKQQEIEKGLVDLQQKQFDLETAKGPNAILRQQDIEKGLLALQEQRNQLAMRPYENQGKILELDKKILEAQQTKQEIAKTAQNLQQDAELHPLDKEAKLLAVKEQKRKEVMATNGLRISNQFYQNTGATAEQASKAMELSAIYETLFGEMRELKLLSSRLGYERVPASVAAKADKLKGAIVDRIKQARGFGTNKETGNAAKVAENISKDIPTVGGWWQLPTSALAGLTGDVFAESAESEIQALYEILAPEATNAMRGYGFTRAIPPELIADWEQMQREKGGS